MMTCPTGPHSMTSSMTPNQPQSTQLHSDFQDTQPIVWIIHQGRKYGPYWGISDAQKDGFVVDMTPLDEIPLGGWPVKWPEIPKVNC